MTSRILGQLLWDLETPLLKQRHQLFVALLSIADGLVIVAACLSAWGVRRWMVEGSIPPPWSADATEAWIRQPMVVPILVLTLISMWFFGLYRPRRDQTLWEEQSQIIKASVGALLGMAAMAWLIGGQELYRPNGEALLLGIGLGGASMSVEAARVQMLSLLAILPLSLGAFRVCFRWVLRWLRSRGFNQRHVLMIGTGRLARIACRTLDRNSWTGIHVAQFISHNEHNTGPSEILGRPVVGGLADLDKVLEAELPDAVYLALPNARSAARPQLLRKLERYCLDVRIIPDVQPRYMPHRVTMSELEGMPILSVRESPMVGVGGAMKRLLDMFGAAVGLVILSPVLLIVAALVRLSGPGPVIFKQRRVSLGGEQFQIYKFRTMVHARQERDEARWTTRNDPRVTRLGAWLRSTSLDELPQLLNVLKGEMSLVGPRPERPELILRFRDDWRGYMLRQHVKAGMTGWAQVNGLRGDTSLKKRLQHDLFYVQHWSLGFDLKILVLTVFRGFVHRNAH
jgi:Undecaprenyl-phosphate glucose phosphotransferase